MFLDVGGHISPDNKSKSGENTSSERLGIFFVFLAGTKRLLRIFLAGRKSLWICLTATRKFWRIGRI
jgi:hypothetical protein